MRKGEMSEQQLAERDLLVEKADAAGWYTGAIEELFQEDFISVQPEGRAEHTNDFANLEVTYHAEHRYVGLLVSVKDDLSDFVRYRFRCGERLAEVLDLLLGAKDTLTPDNHTELAKRAIDICEDVFLEAGEDLYKISR